MFKTISFWRQIAFFKNLNKKKHTSKEISKGKDDFVSVWGGDIAFHTFNGGWDYGPNPG